MDRTEQIDLPNPRRVWYPCLICGRFFTMCWADRFCPDCVPGASLGGRR